MKATKEEIAKIQLERSIVLFLDDDDFVSSLTLAGAAEELLGSLISRKKKTNVLTKLFHWFVQNNKLMEWKHFVRHANFIRNELKHFNEESCELQVCRSDCVQIIMRAMLNWKEAELQATPTILRMHKWISDNQGKYENLE